MKAWLKCNVKPGMFRDEIVAAVTTRDGSSTAYFVDKREVRGNRVRVEVVERQGVKWATMPTDHPYQPVPVRDQDVDPIEDRVLSA